LVPKGRGLSRRFKVVMLKKIWVKEGFTHILKEDIF